MSDPLDDMDIPPEARAVIRRLITELIADNTATIERFIAAPDNDAVARLEWWGNVITALACAGPMLANALMLTLFSDAAPGTRRDQTRQLASLVNDAVTRGDVPAAAAIGSAMIADRIVKSTFPPSK